MVVEAIDVKAKLSEVARKPIKHPPARNWRAEILS